MDNFYDECPRKVLIKQFFHSKVPSPVWINGKIEQTVGTNILIINDGTGRVKISNCDSVNSPEDRSWIIKGSQCCVIGMLIKTKGLPEVSPLKLIHISHEADISSWISEVEELDLFLEGKILPDLGV